MLTPDISEHSLPTEFYENLAEEALAGKKKEITAVLTNLMNEFE